ncbi:hypothetical protein KIH79_05770 [Bifidobacterium sp. 82T10]|uniref:DUF559 domain-containing protein n=1 Tax=Bifidobacterium miconis TaxID=2834435 RepID=A0ABS6WEJ4_9BIFI|nr:hypothetical protein [Bifidobacterium miconis]MBW3092458.1 hypothetical protein [Bifidobacterium miconis]
MQAQRRTRNKLVFAMSTALDLLSVEQPRMSGINADDLVACVRKAGDRPRLRDVRFVVWEGPLATVEVERLTCVDPVHTWMMMASRLALEELVVLGDSMMRRDLRLRRAGLDDFESALQRFREWKAEYPAERRLPRGFNNCVKALRLMRERTDSSMETRTRLTLMRYGLPCPEVNHAIQDPQTSRTLLLDMAFPQWRVAVEYDGRHHASQWLTDSNRRKRIEDAGWSYVQVTSLDLGAKDSEEALARRVAARIADKSGHLLKISACRSIARCADGRSFRYLPG